MLQSEAGYINARPHLPDRGKPLATHGRTIHSGQTRTSADVCDTTASPPEADMTGSPSDVAEVPHPDSCTAANSACYSITSSARASSVGGISMPSDLAVFRLIVNSNLVGCSMGRSAGFSPLRMRLTKEAARRDRSATVAV